MLGILYFLETKSISFHHLPAALLTPLLTLLCALLCFFLPQMHQSSRLLWKTTALPVHRAIKDSTALTVKVTQTGCS